MSENDQRPGDVPPEYAKQAAGAVGAVQAGSAADAGDSVEAMAEQLAQQKVRAALSDFETQLQAQMEQAQSQASQLFAAQNARIQQLQGQITSLRAAAGPPDAVNLAASLKQRVASIQSAASSTVPAAHFAGVTSQAETLNDQVTAIANGDAGDDTAAAAEKTASGIITWFEKRHPKLSNVVLEGSHAAVDEAERIIDALPGLAQLASLAAKAV